MVAQDFMKEVDGTQERKAIQQSVELLQEISEPTVAVIEPSFSRHLSQSPDLNAHKCFRQLMAVSDRRRNTCLGRPLAALAP